MKLRRSSTTVSGTRRGNARRLKEYEKKRDFSVTSEPPAIVPRESTGALLQFVVHKHENRHPHFDLRLEINGVLKSWAVPKGLPTRCGDKRLAVEVEDHPLKYARFQGVIPPGSYGAGTVSIWDSGTYEAVNGDPMAAWESGKLRVFLAGQRFRGEWTLVKANVGSGEKRDWLIFKNNGSGPKAWGSASICKVEGITCSELMKRGQSQCSSETKLASTGRALRAGRPNYAHNDR
jgi:DNA ligase D-like protein (predicted 3'-phosphoesterase)